MASLAAQARRCLEARDGSAAWLLAERLVRARRGMVADDLVLRSLTLAALDDAAGAWRDVRAALAIDPLHPFANRLALASPDQAERDAATRRLQQPARGAGSERDSSDPVVAAAPEPARRPAAKARGRRRVAVIVPVYDDFTATELCFRTLLANPGDRYKRRIIAIDDVTPDPRIAALLDELAQRGQIELVRNPDNGGFAMSVNRGLEKLGPDEDVLLLNADTIAPPDLCARMARVAYMQDDIGTVTPLSNNGEYTSMPVRFRENPLPPPDVLVELDRLAASQDAADPVDLPNGVGFCLYVKRAVLETIGPLSAAFGRGYYEDVEFCLRARAAGFRHVCAPGIFVGHAGSRSFKDEKRSLVVANLPLLARLYPGYREQSAGFVRQDPLRAAIARLEQAWLFARQTPLVLLVRGPAHDATLVEHYAATQRAAGLDTIVATVEDGGLRLRDQAGGLPQNVVLTGDGPRGLLRDIARLSVAHLAIADPDNLPDGLAAALAEMDWPYDVLLADSGSVDTRRPAAGSTGRVLAGSRHILPATRRLAQALAARFPDAMAKMLAPPERQPGGRRAAVPQVAASHDLLVVCDALSFSIEELVRGLAIALRQADPRSGIVVDGATSDDRAAMAPGNVFVLGEASADMLSCATSPGTAKGVLFPSRRWGLGDARLDGWMARGVPTAFFDPSVQQCDTAGRDLRLPPDASLEAAVSALRTWWLSLA
ncbi:glycosyltransferase family 2 protein [Vineibacter terrae]|uniref:Glycosyltransferase family 2 protein n=1 Tax=Vineibacter terrae TaxID=2586908 RepID=A0A5C8P9L2_9HYPH|nr:glycosyltransferase [Vineibacter terrae]TXL69892.1 glycosyltransferase family 2 protein [Vineibacter terrae]